MVMQAKAALLDGRIVDFNYEVWSNTHSMRPNAPASANNLLASWYLAEPQPIGPATNIPQPAGGGDRNAVPLYDFPRQRIVNHLIKEMPIRVSTLRTLGAYANVFALESFMDELAAAAGADPVAFRLAHLKDARARAVISAVATKADWKEGEKSDGQRGRGIGFAKYKNLSSYVAVVAEVTVDRASGRVRVPRAWAAVDSGQVINPDGLANQIEGGIVQSTSWTLHEAVRFDRNGITSRDWSSYPILTVPEAPHVEVELIDRRNHLAPARARQDRPSRPSSMRWRMRPANACASCRSSPSGSRRRSGDRPGEARWLAKMRTCRFTVMTAYGTQLPLTVFCRDGRS